MTFQCLRSYQLGSAWRLGLCNRAAFSSWTNAFYSRWNQKNYKIVKQPYCTPLGVGGRPQILRTTDKNAWWLLEEYERTSRDPILQTVAQPIFNGILPFETDLYVFGKYGGLTGHGVPGVDFISNKNAWVYHTSQDDYDQFWANKGSTRLYGEPVLSLIVGAMDRVRKLPKQEIKRTVVGFDLFESTLVMYTGVCNRPSSCT